MARAGHDTDAFGKNVDQANRKIDELDAKLGRAREGLGLGIAAGTVATLGFATKAASDLREAQAAANVVFGEGATVVNSYAADAAQAIGLSKKEALDATSVFGNMFTQLGVGQQEAARLSTSLVTLGADFGSFFNEDANRVIEAQTAAFRGEYDALQRYVPTINAAAVQQQAMAETGKTNADQLTMQEKALATYTLMVQGAGAAQGDFARSNGSAATEAKKASAELKNSSAEIGQALLPVAAAGAKALGSLASGFSSLPKPAQTAIVGLGGMTAATVLLLPKLVETGQLLGHGAVKAIEFGRAMASAGLASTVSMGIVGAAVLGIAAALGTVALVAHDQAEMVKRAREEVDGLVDAVVDGGKSIQDVADQYLIDQWIEFGPTFEAAGLSFADFRDLVVGSQADFDRWAASAGGDQFLGADVQLGAMRSQMASFNTELGKRRDLEAENARLAQEANNELAERKRLEDEATAVLRRNATGLLGLAGVVDELQPKLGTLFDEYMADSRDAAQLAGDLAGYYQSTAEVAAAVQGVADAGEQVADARDAVAIAERSVADANRSVETARRGVADAERSLAQARDGVADAERRVVDAQVAAADAAERVTSATQDLAQAREDAQIGSDYMADSLQRVTDAEERWRDTQAESLIAQQELTQARDDYTQTLQNLSDAAGGAADDVTTAEIRLRKAQEDLATLGDDAAERVAEAQRRLAELGPNATASQIAAAQKALRDAIAALPTEDDRTAAEIAVREAERRLREAQQRADDAATVLERNQANGVEGSDAVVDAHRRVETAADNEASAYGDLVDAVKNVADTQETALGRVQTAQDNLEQAIRDRAAADQAVLDAKDGVVDANAAVQRATEGVRDANQQVADRQQDVLDREKELVDRKGDVVTAEGEKAGAIEQVKIKLEEQATSWLGMKTQWEFGSVLRQNLRGITGEIRDLAGFAGTHDVNVNVNLGGNAAQAILDGTLGGLFGALEVAAGGKNVGHKGGPGSSSHSGVDLGKPALPSGWVQQPNGRWYHPRMPGEANYGDGYSDYRPGATPTGRSAGTSGTYAGVPTMAPNWAQPSTYAATSLNPRATVDVGGIHVDARGIDSPAAVATATAAEFEWEMNLLAVDLPGVD